MRLIALIAAMALGMAASAADANPSRWQYEFPNTDFENTTVPIDEIVSVIPRDNIPAIDNPAMISVADETAIGDREPVITVEIEGAEPRAYPVRYLTWHEIANDQAGGVPFSVTFCPLCNSGLVFDRRIEGQVLSFGVSGKLRNSDMVMYDRETETWWQQAIGTGIVGDLAGIKLTQLPAWMESWAEYKARNPDGLVMGEPNWNRRYGQNPYVGYDSGKPWQRFYSGEMPPHGINPMMRVVRVGEQAWPFDRLSEEKTVTENGVTITWTAGQASALDAGQIADARDVGTVRVRDANGNNLPHDVMFAFAYHAFFPEGEWMLGSS
ncbi:MAG: DUF3179 domain-containing protein [Pseudomonadota bacterium]